MLMQQTLRRALMLVLALAVGIAFSLVGQRSASAQEGLTRTVIMKKDLEADPKKEVTMFIAEYKPEVKSGKHYHPGQEFIYVLEGQGKLEEVGKPPVDLKPGVSIYFQSDPDKPTYVHEATNLSKTGGMKLLVVLITEKGRPLAIPVK